MWSSRGNYIFFQPYLWSEKQNLFLELMILLSGKSTISFSVIFLLSILQIDDGITSENLIQRDVPRITQLLATHYDGSKQKNQRHFSLTRVQKCGQAPPEIEYFRTFASVVILAIAKLNKLFALPQLFKRMETSVVKVHIIKAIDMTVWIGRLIPCHYQTNWNLMKVFFFETLPLRIVLNWISILITVPSFILKDWVLKFKLKKTNAIHSVQIEHCTHRCIHPPTKYFWLDY